MTKQQTKVYQELMNVGLIPKSKDMHDVYDIIVKRENNADEAFLKMLSLFTNTDIAEGLIISYLTIKGRI